MVHSNENRMLFYATRACEYSHNKDGKAPAIERVHQTLVLIYYNIDRTRLSQQ